jgi:ribonuclease HII
MSGTSLPLFAPEGPVAGVDEAGRGPLAGPVVAAAVILAEDHGITGLDDSKKLSEARRDELAADIRRSAIAWSVAWADAAEIDAMNILRASLLAMRRALLGLPLWPASVFVDGNSLPRLDFFGRSLSGTAIVGGDGSVASISAASILAKVSRDRMMREADVLYPEYGFAAHKGYGTPMHLDSLARHGPCRLHRRSFRPIRRD